MHDVKAPPAHPERRYETRDVAVRPLVYSAIGLALLTLVGMLASWLAFKYFIRVQKLGPPASPFENTRELPPAPRLQVNPAETLKAYQAEENSKLNSFGWVDQNAGIVRIPIDRAMELSLRQGFPVRASNPATPGEPGQKAAGPMATRPTSPSASEEPK